MWSFNRTRDAHLIQDQEIQWKGPLSWPKYEEYNDLEPIPNVQGVYLFTFKYKNGYFIYSAGITNSMKTRFSAHTREYKKGNYNVLDVDSAIIGERREIWHGWQYAKNHREDFILKKDKIMLSVDRQLISFHIFIAELSDVRTRERLEAAVMQNIYLSKESWSEVADRGMFLKMRNNSEIPINVINKTSKKIYGLLNSIEI